jgi:hypothetical protein
MLADRAGQRASLAAGQAGLPLIVEEGMKRNLGYLLMVMLVSWAAAQQESPYTPSPYAAVSGQAIAVRADGGLVVTGLIREPLASKNQAGTESIFVAWLSAEGDIERLARFGTEEGAERVGSAALAADGSLFLAGKTTGAFSGAVGTGMQFIAKITPAGEMAWVRQLHGGESAIPAVAGIGEKGEVYLAGSIANGKGVDGFRRSPGFHPYYDAYLMSLDGDGTELWFTTFAVDTTQFPTDVVPLPNREVAVLGIRAPEAPLEFEAKRAYGFAARLSSNGTLLDSFDLSREGNSVTYYRGVPYGEQDMLITFATTIGVGKPDYDETEEPGFDGVLGFDAVIGHWDEHGQLVWAKDFGEGKGYIGADVVVGATGEVTVVGSGNGNLGGPNLGVSDAFVITYSPDGERLWADRFGTSGFDQAEAVTAAPDGTIYLTGAMQGKYVDLGAGFRTGQFWYVAAYSADGEQLWLREYAAEPLESDAR